jgi:hypothetical protein
MWWRMKGILCQSMMLDFKVKTNTFVEITLPMRNINHLQGANTLRALKLNSSLDMEPIRTQDANKRATQILDAKYNKADLQSIVRDNCKQLSTDHKKSYCSFS